MVTATIIGTLLWPKDPKWTTDEKQETLYKSSCIRQTQAPFFIIDTNARWQQTYQVNFHCCLSSEHITKNNGFYLVSLLPLSVPKVFIILFISPEDDQSMLIETSSWNQRFFSEPPQLIRDSQWCYHKPFHVRWDLTDFKLLIVKLNNVYPWFWLFT